VSGISRVARAEHWRGRVNQARGDRVAELGAAAKGRSIAAGGLG
jgi:hypothetical protein